MLDDDAALRSHGYTPELARKMGGFGNTAISFTVICVLAGGMTMFGFGMNAGGPAVIMGGWVGIGFMTLILAMCLGEVTSAYPTSGGLYYMAHRLGGQGWAWVTGWLNLLGLVGAICGIDYGCALVVGAFANLQWGLDPTPGTTFLIFVGILVLHGILNSFGVRLVNVLNSISVWWQLSGVTLIVATLALAPGERQSADFVFTHFNNGTGFDNPAFVAGLGCLMAAYTFCGYDASSHLSEETKQAQIAAPQGMVRAVAWSLGAGFVLLAGLLFAIEDYAGTLGTSTGFPPAQIFIDVLGTGVAKGLLLVVILAQVFCGNAETAAASRMAYAFSRDGALPFSATWRRVTRRTKTPLPAVWLCVGIALLLALPSLYSPTAYAAVTAINVIGITPAYVIPVYLRRRHPERFEPGPWNLGRWSKPLGWTSVGYVCVLTVFFCLPQSSPVTVETFNYAGVTLVAVLLLSWLTWITKGRRSYRIPTLGSEAESIAYSEGVV
ncbi:amino acid permease [Streptomyces sp. Qhu-G9]|uniref:amino acid permease n=1 Tax=Streptomyces sp. Qhu-G9 TaxID=3452799 RepID=UPI0022AC0947|nr:amino acid permease [Streptomyces aurantiacus]WAU79973.1 amino acid permease [Streptomyces aurantiacus]